MADYNGDNYQAQWVDKPSSKLPKGENAGRKRLLLEHKTLKTALLVGDKILGPYIPASSIVTNAKISISKSLGPTGIFDGGYLANGVDAADQTAFVSQADGGLSGDLKSADSSNAGIFKRFSEQTQIVLEVTEAVDGSVIDGVITFEIEYVND